VEGRALLQGEAVGGDVGGAALDGQPGVSDGLFEALAHDAEHQVEGPGGEPPRNRKRLQGLC